MEETETPESSLSGCRTAGEVSDTPAALPERYAQTSPMTLLPLGLPQVIVLGEHEEYVPRQFAQVYVDAAERAGDRVRLLLIPGAGHFEIASPRTAIWPPRARPQPPAIFNAFLISCSSASASPA